MSKSVEKNKRRHEKRLRYIYIYSYKRVAATIKKKQEKDTSYRNVPSKDNRTEIILFLCFKTVKK